MGKAGKWFKSLLTGKKCKDKEKPKEQVSSSSNNSSVGPAEQPATPVHVLPTTPKEKRRWSFRRSSATSPAEQRKHEDGEDVSIQVTPPASAVEDRAAGTEIEAIKIQSAFRGYLARKALSALRGLVKLQALVRGHLVRKQATATLRRMQALVTAQARALAQRARLADHTQTTPSRKLRHSYTFHEAVNEGGVEENIKIVEMDCGEYFKDRNRNRNRCEVSPVVSAITDVTPRTYSGHFDERTLGTGQSSPQCECEVSKPDPSASLRSPFSFLRPEDQVCYEYPMYPSYMANTESSRAKVRSQSAPKSRPAAADSLEKRRRASIEGRNVPRPVRMQRSSSNAAHHNHQHPWLIKLDKSTASLVDSECGSTSTMVTNYSRPLFSYTNVQGSMA